MAGHEEFVEELIETLNKEETVSSSSHLEPICIVGSPLVGKTNAALKVFNDPRIGFHFPTRVWVSVSDVTARDVYLAIINKFAGTGAAASGSTNSQLALNVREHLRSQRFLIVLDDVSTIDAWNGIKIGLPIENASGGVLITTRNKEVAAYANPGGDPYHLRFLNQKETWQLLQSQVYGKNGNWPDNLQNLGQAIARKCEGFPLAVALIAGVLASTPENGWKGVSHRLEGSVVEGGDREVNLEKVLSLCFDELPYHLRDCFLFLGAFSENSEISVWKLIRMWIAEGFIKEDNNISLEEAAENYVNQLIRRNLVMADKKSISGRVKKLRMNDRTHRFCKKEAENLNIIREVRISGNQFVPSVSEINDFRRLCVHSSVIDFFSKSPSSGWPNVRSFISLSQKEVQVPLQSVSSIPETFQLIRVFEGSSINFPKFSPKFLELVHLKYLNLKLGEGFTALPASISNLKNLETIVIVTPAKTFEVDDGILETNHLRHLKTNSAIVVKEPKFYSRNKDSHGEHSNKCLQTLNGLSATSFNEDVFKKSAAYLKVLCVRGDLSSILSTAGCVKKLNHLEKLKLVNDARRPMSRFLDPSIFPESLRSLTLSGTRLDWREMSTLSKVLRLSSLKLKENAFQGEKWDAVGYVFYSLERLQIEFCDLKTWRVSNDAFYELSYLAVKNCKNLAEIPRGLERKLKILEISSATTSAIVSAFEIEREIGKNPRRHDFELRVDPSDLERMKKNR